MIELNRNSKDPLYMQIYTQVKTEILTGVLKEGDLLAGSRALAKTLCISRNTVDNAYGQLLAEGYISPKRGVGYLVLPVPERQSTIPQQRGEKRCQPLLHEIASSEVHYDLTNSSHTSDLFPKRLWRKFTLEGLDRLEREESLSIHLDKQGELYLRHHLRSYLERIRGVRCREEQMVITSGIQQSLAYICKLLPASRPVILMEEPGYHKAAAVFKHAGLTVQTIPVDQHGLRVSKLPAIQNACAVYTTPSHQFPTGAILPIGRRYELLQWAREKDLFIIEDDFDSEQRYYAKPIPSLQSIDADDRVIYLGTFSKSLSPSIRMGYMILPPLLSEAYAHQFTHYNSTIPLLNQYIIGRLIETGQYERHIRRLNNVFRKRLECFSNEFSGLKGKVNISSNGSGQYFLLSFVEKVSQETLIERALRHGVRVYSTMQFWQDKADCPPNTLFLGFSKIDFEDIPDCVARLKSAWKEWL